MCLINKTAAIINVTNSADGLVSQTPGKPIIFGNVNKNITTKIKDLQNETKADKGPLPIAVKYPEINILKPHKAKVKVNSLNPLTVISKTTGSSVKI